jgi:hypothetical protein
MKNRLLMLMFGFLMAVGMPLAASAGPTPDGSPDLDGDGIEDEFDNCILPLGPGQGSAANPGQEDSDHDGCGDACELACDINGDGLSDFGDFAILQPCFGQTPGVGPCPLTADCAPVGAPDGLIDFGDFSALQPTFGDTPGPSGLLPQFKAGAPQCP